MLNSSPPIASDRQPILQNQTTFKEKQRGSLHFGPFTLAPPGRWNRGFKLQVSTCIHKGMVHPEPNVIMWPRRGRVHLNRRYYQIQGLKVRRSGQSPPPRRWEIDICRKNFSQVHEEERWVLSYATTKSKLKRRVESDLIKSAKNFRQSKPSPCEKIRSFDPDTTKEGNPIWRCSQNRCSLTNMSLGKGGGHYYVENPWPKQMGHNTNRWGATQRGSTCDQTGYGDIGGDRDLNPRNKWRDRAGRAGKKSSQKDKLPRAVARSREPRGPE